MVKYWRYYLLLNDIKYHRKNAKSLLQLSRAIRETLFERRGLIDILTNSLKELLAAQ